MRILPRASAQTMRNVSYAGAGEARVARVTFAVWYPSRDGPAHRRPRPPSPSPKNADQLSRAYLNVRLCDEIM